MSDVYGVGVEADPWAPYRLKVPADAAPAPAPPAASAPSADPYAAYRVGPGNGAGVPPPPPPEPTQPGTYDDPLASQQPAIGSPAVPPPEPVDPKYKAAAVAQLDKQDRLARAVGVPDFLSGPAAAYRLLGHGASFNTSDEINALLSTPGQMYDRGTWDPREGYKYAKAVEDLRLQRDRELTGWGGTAAEFTGGMLSGAPLVKGAMKAAEGASALSKIIRGGTTGAELGGAAGFAEGDGIDDRFKSGAKGALLGTVAGLGGGAMATPVTSKLGQIPAGVLNWGKNVVAGSAVGGSLGEGLAGEPGMGAVLGAGAGAFLPAVAPAAGYGLRLLQAPRALPPENVTLSRVGKVLEDSGRSSAGVVQDIRDANASGQQYTLADAIGTEAQNALRARTKQEGPARQAAAEILTGRTIDAPPRTGYAAGRGLNATKTAEQATEDLIKEGQTKSRPIYDQANDIPTWSPKLQEFYDHKDVKKGLAHGVDIQGRENVGTGQPFNPTDAMITGFNEAGDPIITGVPNVKTLNTAKIGLDRMIEAAMVDGQHTAESRSLLKMKNNMLAEADALNPKYAEARATFRGPMEVKDAVAKGRDWATRGRWEDNMREFDAMSPFEQQGARIGYADAVRGKFEGPNPIYPSILKEKSTMGREQLDRLSLYQGPRLPVDPALRNTPMPAEGYDPYASPPRMPPRLQGDQLRQFLNREETMQKTSNMSLGGSPTAEILGDMASPAESAAVGVAKDVATGNKLGLFKRGVDALERINLGESVEQRTKIVQALMEHEPDAVKAIVDRLDTYNANKQAKAAAVRDWRGALFTTAPSALKDN